MSLLPAYRTAIADALARPSRYPGRDMLDAHASLFRALAHRHGWDAVNRHTRLIDTILRSVEGRPAKPTKAAERARTLAAYERVRKHRLVVT